MNLEERKKNIPEEFKQLAQDFSDNGFITTSLDNLVNWAQLTRLSSDVVIKPLSLKSCANCLNSSGIFFFLSSKFILFPV